jgi:hypothetical protein
MIFCSRSIVSRLAHTLSPELTEDFPSLLSPYDQGKAPRASYERAVWWSWSSSASRKAEAVRLRHVPKGYSVVEYASNARRA